MAAIDVGNAAIDRDGGSYIDQTRLNLGNPANESGILDTFELWLNIAGSNVKMGTFFGSGDIWTNRDYEPLGTVASGSKQTFSGLDCAVETGDILGAYGTAGRVDASSSGDGTKYKAGDQFDAGTQTYGSVANFMMSMYATGETVLVTSIKIACGIAIDDVQTMSTGGIAILNVQMRNGISNVE